MTDRPAWWRRCLLAVMLLVPVACSPRLPAERTLRSDDWGDYRVQPPVASVTRLAFVFASADDSRLDPLVHALSARGALVARIDPARFAAGLQRRRESCLDLAGIVNWHANYLGRRFGLSTLAPPLLVGAGNGAALVYALLAQAPPLTFAAAVSDAPTGQLSMPGRLCDVSGPPDARGAVHLEPVALAAPWTVAGDTGTDPLLAAVRRRNPADRVQVTTAPLARAAIDAFAALQAASHHAASIADLPVVELPAAHPTDTLAVIYTGDGGWRDIDRTLGGLLAQSGIAVVGVDSVRYFWHRRSPTETAADLGRILDHYQTAWGSRRVLLIGYSFGADILPFAYNRLPADRQARIATLALLAPGRDADFEVSVSGWLGGHTKTARPIAPELLRIPPDKVLCVYGAQEAADTLCTAPGVDAIGRLQRPGDHHFDRRYDIIADAIRAHFQPPAGARPPGPPPGSRTGAPGTG